MTSATFCAVSLEHGSAGSFSDAPASLNKLASSASCDIPPTLFNGRIISGRGLSFAVSTLVSSALGSYSACLEYPQSVEIRQQLSGFLKFATFFTQQAPPLKEDAGPASRQRENLPLTHCISEACSFFYRSVTCSLDTPGPALLETVRNYIASPFPSIPCSQIENRYRLSRNLMSRPSHSEKTSRTRRSRLGRPTILILGVGSFAHSTSAILRQAGARVVTYLTRDYAHDGAQSIGKTYYHRELASPIPLLQKHKVHLVIPMSIDWAEKPWAAELVQSGVPFFCPTGEALNLERERDLARKLCLQNGILFPRSFWARSQSEASKLVAQEKRPFVIKNPICGPSSPIHTIVCETADDTKAWLPRLDYKDGVFLQEYLGRAEAGHIAFVSGGEIHSVATNQEYKRAFDGDQGIVAGAPLGGLVEQDPKDKYGLARALLHPLRDWFRATNFHGPVQVTAIRRNNQWHVVEYNVRIGVTSGAMILRMLEDPLATLLQVARNQPLDPIRFRKDRRFGCSVTLAGYGYPYTQLTAPEFPVRIDSNFSCDVWWNEVRKSGRQLFATGHRIADVVCVDKILSQAIRGAYKNIQRIHCLASYYRTDIGASLWPPGKT
jgi:phosphoribosylamine-glycine ligase